MKRTTPIHLSEDERTHVEVFVRRGKANARTLTRARVLLKCDEGWSNGDTGSYRRRTILFRGAAAGALTAAGVAAAGCGTAGKDQTSLSTSGRRGRSRAPRRRRGHTAPRRGARSRTARLSCC